MSMSEPGLLEGLIEGSGMEMISTVEDEYPFIMGGEPGDPKDIPFKIMTMTIKPWLTEMAEGKIPNAFEIAESKFDSELKTEKYATLNENGGVVTKAHRFKMAIAHKKRGGD